MYLQSRGTNQNYKNKINPNKQRLRPGNDSSLPVCLVSCTVYLQLFTNIDIQWVRPESTYNKQICSTLSA